MTAFGDAPLNTGGIENRVLGAKEKQVDCVAAGFGIADEFEPMAGPAEDFFEGK